MEVSFVLAEKSNLVTLVNMVREYHSYDHIPFHEETVTQILDRLIDNPDVGRVWVMQMDREVIGYLCITFSYSIEYLGKNSFIDELYVREPFRGKGIGHQAIEFAKKAAKDFGVEAIHLEAERNNDRAIHLYRKKGFQDPDRVLMTCWLNKT